MERKKEKHEKKIDKALHLAEEGDGGDRSRQANEESMPKSEE